jgi:hypothetical protein
LVLVVADLLIATFALMALTTPSDKRNRNPLPDRCPSHVAANRHDHASKLVPRHMRELLDIRISPMPAMPVTAAEPSCFDSNHRAVRCGRRFGHGFGSDLAAELVIDDCFHESLLVTFTVENPSSKVHPIERESRTTPYVSRVLRRPIFATRLGWIPPIAG